MPSAQQLIGELLDESLRARLRRLHVTGRTECTLYALKAVDAKLDRNVLALASFGDDALNALEAKVNESQGPMRDAAVHLLCAVATQMPAGSARDQALLQIVQRHQVQHELAVRDALWFFPVGLLEFEIRQDHVDLLLRQSDPMLQLFGVWAGFLRGALQAAVWASDYLSHFPPGSQASEAALRRCCELALASLGAELPDADRCQKLLEGSAADRRHALDLLAASGRAATQLTVQQCLQLAQTDDPALQRQAWFVASAIDPRACATAAHRAEQLGDEWRVLLDALGGSPESLVRTAASLCAAEEPPSPECSDALHLLLGHVPVAARQTPVDSPLRESQVRSDVLHLLRRAHINVNNQAHVCAWDESQVLATEALNAGVRLRYGHRLVGSQVPGIPVEIASRLSAVVRQTLYWEQARARSSPFGRGLSAYANARMQYLVLEAAAFNDEHLALQVA